MTTREILMKHIPKDCYWEDMDNLTNTPVKHVLSAMDEQAEQLKRLKERIAANEQNHRLAEVSGINKAIRVINRELQESNSWSETRTLSKIIKELTEEGKVLLEEAENINHLQS